MKSLFVLSRSWIGPLWAVAGSIAIVACGNANEPRPFPGAVPYDPPARFGLWWAMVQSCSGKQADTQSIRWYRVPGSFLSDGSSGAWVASTREIYIAEGALNSPSLIRHEMLHALLNVHGHPADQFLGKCDGIVACDDICIAAAGGRPPVAVSAPEIDAIELESTLEVSPMSPATTQYGGAMAVTLSVRNPNPYDVWVRLARSPGQPATTFEVMYDAGNPAGPVSGRGVATSAARFAFGAGETRRYVWDETAKPGTLGIRGIFNTDTTLRLAVVVK
jgi:hypothetical protein